MIRHLHTNARELLLRHRKADWPYALQVALFALLLGFPFLGSWVFYPLIVFDVVFMVFIFYSILLLESPSMLLLFTGLAALFMLSLRLATGWEFANEAVWSLKVEWMLLVCFFILMGVKLVMDALNTRISMKLIYISIVNYFNIGLLFSFLYRIEHYRDPNALNFQSIEPYNYIYMSFVVLSSVGLGDLLPQTTSAKSVVVIEALAGQLYLTFFVALIIGKYLSEPRSMTKP